MANRKTVHAATRVATGLTATEDEVQTSIVEWLTILENQGRLTFFHVTNNPRNKVHGARLKRLGMRVGVADLVVLCPPRPGEASAQCIFIEVKRDGGKHGIAQIKWAELVRGFGFAYATVRSLDEARIKINNIYFKSREG